MAQEPHRKERRAIYFHRLQLLFGSGVARLLTESIQRVRAIHELGSAALAVIRWGLLDRVACLVLTNLLQRFFAVHMFFLCDHMVA